MAALHLSHVIPGFWWGNRTCFTGPQFLAPEKSVTRMHGRQAKLLVPLSGHQSVGAELGSCVTGLTERL